MQHKNLTDLDYKLLTNLPCLVGIKNTNSQYIGMSREFADLGGWKNPDEGLYKTDYDLCCRASESADYFQAQDKIVRDTGKQLIAVHIQNYSNGLKIMLIKKSPIKDRNGLIIGTISHLIDIQNTNMFKWYKCTKDLKLDIYNLTHPAIYALDQEYYKLKLSKRQESCIFLLVRGKSLKQIASILELSVRTVESYVEDIKLKLGCASKNQLIEKAINYGFFYYIPQELIKNYQIDFT